MRNTHATEREQAERPGRAVLDTIPVQIWSGPPDGTLDYCNDQWRAYTGLSLEELRGHGWRRILHPDDKDRVLKAWQMAVTNGAPYELEARLRRADGVYRWFLCRALPLRDAEGRITSWYGANTDIEDCRRVEDSLREREEFQRQLMNNTFEFIRLFDTEGRLVYANSAVERLLEAVPARAADFAHPEDREALRRWFEGVLTGSKDHLQWRVQIRGGEWRWMETQGTVVPHKGRPHVLTVCRDITDRRRAAEALRQSERRLNEAQRIAHIGHWEYDLEADRITASDEVYRIFGFPPQQDLRTWEAWQAPVHPEDLGTRAAAIERALREGPRYEVEYRVVRPDGEVRTVHSQGEIERDATGRPRRLFGVVQDITDRKRADEELRRTTALLQAVIDTTSDAVFVKDRQGKYILFNAAASRSPGKPAAEVLGRDDTALFDPVSARAVMEHDRRVMESGEESTEEQDLLAGGVRHTYLTTKVPYRDERGQVVGVIGIAHEITKRKRAEEELRRSEELLKRIEAMAHVGGWTLTVADGAVTASEEGQSLFGWAPGPRRLEDLMALVHPDDRPAVEAALRAALAGTPFETEHRIVVGGQVKWVRRRVEPELDTAGRVVRLVGVSQDITERRMLEEQFRQAQKMEAIGTLAGGVAHDFNNLLTIINGCSELLLSRVRPGDPMGNLLAEIHKAGERAGSLTRQLLMFSRQQVVDPKVLDLNAVVADTEKMLRRLIGEDVVLTVALGPAIAPVKADTGQLQQVLMNLSVNARDAMPQGGRLLIETRNVTLDEHYAHTHPRARPGEYVLLTVSDTGAGMDPHTKLRIFEPFFTTKGAGKGTGLGLAVVHGVVTQSEGLIEVHSEAGKGTTFKIYLPAVKEWLPARKSFHGVHPLPRGSETVLLVEDEDAVRALARHVLTSCGYTTLEAADGREAVQVAEQHPGRIDLVVSDVVMPYLGGRQLVERLAAVRPGLKVLFLSGYTDDAVIRHGVLEAEYAFLQKPFTPTALAQKVREVLNAQP